MSVTRLEGWLTCSTGGPYDLYSAVFGVHGLNAVLRFSPEIYILPFVTVNFYDFCIPVPDSFCWGLDRAALLGL